MPNVLENRRPLWSALFTGTGFAILMLALQVTDSPLRMLLGALAIAVLAGMTTCRQQQGKPLLPTSVLVLFG